MLIEKYKSSLINFSYASLLIFMFISSLIYTKSIIAFFKLTNKGIADMPPL